MQVSYVLMVGTALVLDAVLALGTVALLVALIQK
jgi:hypothetical protein